MEQDEGSIEKEGLDENQRKEIEEKMEKLKDRYAQVERNMVMRHFKEGIPASEAGDYNPITREGRSEAHTFRWPLASPQETSGRDPDIVSPELYTAAKGKLAGGFQRPNSWESQEGDEELNFPDYAAPITLPEYKFGQGRSRLGGLHTRTGPAFSDASHPTERELKRINIQNTLIKIIEKDNVPISDWIKRIQSRGQQQPEQPVPAPTPPPTPEGYNRAIGGGVTGKIDFNEMLPDPSSNIDPDTGINYHPEHPWWDSRDGTISQWRKNTFPRYWYHMPNVSEFGGAPDGGIKAYSSSGSSFKEHADKHGYEHDPHLIWLSQVPYLGDPLGSPRHKKYGDAGVPRTQLIVPEGLHPTARGHRLEDPRLHQYHNMPSPEGTPDSWNTVLSNRRRGIPESAPLRGQKRHIRIIDITKLRNGDLLRSGVNPVSAHHGNYLQHAGDIPLEAIVNPFEAIDATEPITHYINKEDDMHVKSVLANGQAMGKFPRSIKVDSNRYRDKYGRGTRYPYMDENGEGTHFRAAIF